MKYTITINQLAVVKSGLNLDLKDCAILDYLFTFSHHSGVEKRHEGGSIYFWFSHANIRQNMPLLGITTNKAIYNRMMKYCYEGLLLSHPNNQQLSRSYYAVTDKLCSLYYGDEPGLHVAPGKPGKPQPSATPEERLLSEENVQQLENLCMHYRMGADELTPIIERYSLGLIEEGRDDKTLIQLNAGLRRYIINLRLKKKEKQSRQTVMEQLKEW